MQTSCIFNKGKSMLLFDPLLPKGVLYSNAPDNFIPLLMSLTMSLNVKFETCLTWGVDNSN